MSWPYRHVAGLPPRSTKRARYLFNNDDGHLEWRHIAADAGPTIDAVDVLALDNTGTEDCGAILSNTTFDAGSTIFFPEGTYRFSSQWAIEQDHITIRGVGSHDAGPCTTFVCGTEIHMIFSVAPVKAPSFYDIRFEGVESEENEDNATPYTFITYRITNDNAESYDGRIERCYFKYGRSALSLYWTNRFVIQDCTIDSNMITGVNVYGAKNFRISGCTFKNSGHGYTGDQNEDALKFSTGPAASGTVTNVLDAAIIENNTFVDSAQDGLDVHVPHCRNLIIVNNHFRGCAKAMDIKPHVDDDEEFPIEENGLRGWHGLVLQGNTMYNSGDITFNNLLVGEPEGRTARSLAFCNNTFYNGSLIFTGENGCIGRNFIIANNVIRDGMLDVRHLYDSSVVGNSIYISTGETIRSLNNHLVVFANNSVTGGHFRLTTSNEDCTLSGNTISGAELRVENATRCSISNNFVQGVLRTYVGATQCHFFGNFVHNASGDEGLIATNGTDCVYMGNYFWGNRFGALIQSCHSETIFFNNFTSCSTSTTTGNAPLRLNASNSSGRFIRNFLYSPSREAIYVNDENAPAYLHDNIVVKPDSYLTYSQVPDGGITRCVLVDKASDSTPSGFGASYGDIVPTIANDDVLYWSCSSADATTPSWKAILKSSDPSPP